MSKKQPRSVAQPAGGKEPRHAGDPTHYKQQSPTWRIARMDHDGEWAWHTFTGEALKNVVIPRMRNLETMTWAKIESDRHSHPMPTANICKDAKDRLRALKLDDVDMLYQVNIGGKQRLWGIRENNCLILLWWDPEHTVYPTQPRNT